jgi:hypothetical protein
MTSTTGRSPSIAAPIAAPTKPSSAIGVSLEQADLFTQEHDRRVATHLLGQRVVQRLAIRD